MREIAPGDFVTFDFGAAVAGYCADMTRTVVVGPASPRQRRLYEAVRQVQADGVAGMRAGARCCELDAAAKKAIKDAATASIPPTASATAWAWRSTRRRQCGPAAMTFSLPVTWWTVEPGIYVPGFGGVRIEDTVVIEQHARRVLTTTTRRLLELPAGR